MDLKLLVTRKAQVRKVHWIEKDVFRGVDTKIPQLYESRGPWEKHFYCVELRNSIFIHAKIVW